jgi:hypothetical protein
MFGCDRPDLKKDQAKKESHTRVKKSASRLLRAQHAAQAHHGWPQIASFA